MPASTTKRGASFKLCNRHPIHPLALRDPRARRTRPTTQITKMACEPPRWLCHLGPSGANLMQGVPTRHIQNQLDTTSANSALKYAPQEDFSGRPFHQLVTHRRRCARTSRELSGTHRPFCERQLKPRPRTCVLYVDRYPPRAAVTWQLGLQKYFTHRRGS